ncbi:hypothetical protein [Prosthecobacter dejongeii]|uniref:Uncharacterized protein n=1 Tax=Prosthecobacter dejongeii TaxID=48465 RepID=A0A7W7YQ09_9BACT|nr:hypothetical protein [Prosthecobacter dejongeii]MBB5040228.1 hypothetical protein [Prosthecobacter dejongeii]
MKNIVVPLLGAVSIISTGTLAWLLATPPSVDPRAVKLETELQEARQTIAKLKADLARKPTETSPTATGTASTTPAQDPASTAANLPAPPNSGNLRQMLRTPEMRQVLENQQAAQIDLAYGKLFEILRLSPEDKENFRKLLTARQKMQTDLSMQLMEPGLTDQKRQEILAEAKHQSSVYEASIKEFLNEENDWKTFQEWDFTKPDRTVYDTLGRNLFAASSEPLSGSQEQELLKLMAEVRTSPSSIGGLNDQTGGDPSKITDQVIQQQIEQLETNHRIIAERAEGFLTPGQRETLKSYLAQLKTVSKSSMEMFRGINK